MRINELFESVRNETAVLVYGRFNPPTIGHQKLIQAGISLAEDLGGDFFVFPSHSFTPLKKPDANKNPLNITEKIEYLTGFFPNTRINHEHSRTLFESLGWLQGEGYQNIYMVAGRDRIDEFQNMINPYLPYINPQVAPEKAVNFKQFEVIDAGYRNNKFSGIIGVSGSKARQLAIESNLEEFLQITPDGPDELKKKMYNTIRRRLGV